jgi:membrane protease YdiL (CAAX protease family)
MVALSLAVPALFAAVALAVVMVQGAPVLDPLSRSIRSPEWMVGLFTGSVLYGFGEEPGWRGWLQPKLQERHSAFVATLILTPIWAVWHLPFFVYRFQFQGPGTVVGFFVGLLAGAFWLAFLFNGTGSVMVVAVWHALWNVANIALGAVSDTAVAVLNALMMVLGFGVAFRMLMEARANPVARWEP